MFKIQDAISVHNDRIVLGHNLQASLYFLVMLINLVAG